MTTDGPSNLVSLTMYFSVSNRFSLLVYPRYLPVNFTFFLQFNTIILLVVTYYSDLFSDLLLFSLKAFYLVLIMCFFPFHTCIHLLAFVPSTADSQ